MPTPSRPFWSRQTACSMLAIAAITVGMSACGSTEPTAQAPTPSITTQDEASQAPVATAENVTSPKPTEKLQVKVLPVAVLTPIPGLAYAKIKGTNEVFPEIAAQAEFWEGTITRQLTQQARPVGTVQLFRARPGVITDDATRAETLQTFMSDFTQTKKLTKVQIADQHVLTAKNVRGTGGTAAGWLDGRDLIVIFLGPGLPAQNLASTYISTT